MAQARQSAHVENENTHRHQAAEQERNSADLSNDQRHQQNRIGIDREEQQQSREHQPRVVAAQILAADQDRRHPQQERPRRCNRSATNVENAKTRQQCAQSELREKDQDGTRPIGWLSPLGPRLQGVQDGDGDAGHQQIYDENRLRFRPVDAAERPAVKGKAARQPEPGEMPLAPLRPRDDRGQCLHCPILWCPALGITTPAHQ
jgi:hypothetical protein